MLRNLNFHIYNFIFHQYRHICLHIAVFDKSCQKKEEEAKYHLLTRFALWRSLVKKRVVRGSRSMCDPF